MWWLLVYRLSISCLLIFTEKHDVKVSVNDIVIKAVANALRNVPEANGKAFFSSLITAESV